MTHVYLATCDSPSFDETVANAVDLSDESELPESLEGSVEARFWGVEPGSRNESNFERLESGDLVLFYRDDEYVATAWVESTFEDDEWASETYWDDEERPMVYTVSEFESISVPRAKVNAIFGYSGSYSPGSLMRVNPDNVDSHPESIKLALSRVG